MSKPQRSYRTGSKDTYNKFCELHPDIKITYKDYKGIILDYNNSILRHILDTGDTINLPWGIGPISIIKYKRKIEKIISEDGQERYNYNINWPETRKAGKYIYHFNLHTGGFNYTWFWSPAMSRIKFPHTWRLEIWREMKRELPKRLKEPGFKDIYRAHIKRKHFK